jgi:hypothetical protein
MRGKLLCVKSLGCYDSRWVLELFAWGGRLSLKGSRAFNFFLKLTEAEKARASGQEEGENWL